jgi:hypothetical protein
MRDQPTKIMVQHLLRVKNLDLCGMVPSFKALLIPELANIFASCLPPGHQIST